MVDVQTISILFAGLSIAASIVYYASVLRNANKTQQMQLETRQAQLFTSIRDTMDTSEFWMKYKHVVLDTKGLNFEEYTLEERQKVIDENPELYGEMMSLLSFYQHIGWLVKTGLMDINAVKENMHLPVIRVWEKLMPALYRGTEDSGKPEDWDNFDYLYTEMRKYREKFLEKSRDREEHPELKT